MSGMNNIFNFLSHFSGNDIREKLTSIEGKHGNGDGTLTEDELLNALKDNESMLKFYGWSGETNNNVEDLAQKWFKKMDSIKSNATIKGTAYTENGAIGNREIDKINEEAKTSKFIVDGVWNLTGKEYVEGVDDYDDALIDKEFFENEFKPYYNQFKDVINRLEGDAFALEKLMGEQEFSLEEYNYIHEDTGVNVYKMLQTKFEALKAAVNQRIGFEGSYADFYSDVNKYFTGTYTDGIDHTNTVNNLTDKEIEGINKLAEDTVKGENEAGGNLGVKTVEELKTIATKDIDLNDCENANTETELTIVFNILKDVVSDKEFFVNEYKPYYEQCKDIITGLKQFEVENLIGPCEFTIEEYATLHSGNNVYKIIKTNFETLKATVQDAVSDKKFFEEEFKPYYTENKYIINKLDGFDVEKLVGPYDFSMEEYNTIHQSTGTNVYKIIKCNFEALKEAVEKLKQNLAMDFSNDESVKVKIGDSEYSVADILSGKTTATVDSGWIESSYSWGFVSEHGFDKACFKARNAICYDGVIPSLKSSLIAAGYNEDKVNEAAEKTKNLYYSALSYIRNNVDSEKEDQTVNYFEWTYEGKTYKYCVTRYEYKSSCGDHTRDDAGDNYLGIQVSSEFDGWNSYNFKIDLQRIIEIFLSYATDGVVTKASDNDLGSRHIDEPDPRRSGGDDDGEGDTSSTRSGGTTPSRTVTPAGEGDSAPVDDEQESDPRHVDEPDPRRSGGDDDGEGDTSSTRSGGSTPSRTVTPTGENNSTQETLTKEFEGFENTMVKLPDWTTVQSSTDDELRKILGDAIIAAIKENMPTAYELLQDKFDSIYENCYAPIMKRSPNDFVRVISTYIHNTIEAFKDELLA